jgi:hypothetical protein
MSKARWTLVNIKDAGLIETEDGFVKSENLVQKGKVDKLPNLIERAIPNQKIKNAVKSEAGGVRFDSQLERTMYDLLKGAKIDFNFQVEYLLQEKFRYGTEAIRAVKIVVDFVIVSKNMIIDTKGHQTYDNKIKIKLLKKYLTDNNIYYKIEMPRTKKECEELLNRLIYEA